MANTFTCLDCGTVVNPSKDINWFGLRGRGCGSETDAKSLCDSCFEYNIKNLAKQLLWKEHHGDEDESPIGQEQLQEILNTLHEYAQIRDLGILAKWYVALAYQHITLMKMGIFPYGNYNERR